VKIVRGVIGFILGIVARVWLMTLRVELEVHPSLGAFGDRPWVLAFLHGKQWPLLAWKRRRRTAVMVSLSKDGEIQSRALSLLGFTVVRGSSSRGGARGLAALVRKLKRGDHDAAFAVDGPRGPYGIPKPGVLLAARSAGAVIVPMGSAIVGPKVFARAWDRFALAWPFGRVSVVLGPPVELPGDEARAADVGSLATAIAAANDAAEAILAARATDMVGFSRSSPALSRPDRDLPSRRV
jgi:lysophospholipid acyltransferase (LPLAT)-like uncharacterized protein